MESYLLLKYGHVLALVYWLGGDLGTFLASRQVVRRDIGVEARRVALKIMLACDQGPRLAMPATFILGYQMAVSLGLIASPAWLTATVWVLGVAWIADVLILHRGEGKPFAARLAVIDFRFRVVVMLLMAAAASYGLAGAAYLRDERIGWKMLIFAGLMGCGVMIRQHLKAFVPAFAELVTNGPDAAVNDALEGSVARCRPYVTAIWLGLLVNAAIGMRLL